ncbi:hypothetical protein JOM56_014078 [Amanita muscaria]
MKSISSLPFSIRTRSLRQRLTLFSNFATLFCLQCPVMVRNRMTTRGLSFMHSCLVHDRKLDCLPLAILPGSYPKSKTSSPTTDVWLEHPASPSASDEATHNHGACAAATQFGSPPSQTPSTAPGLPISATAIENMGSALQGAHNFTVRDRARITNMVGVNNVTNYGGTIDLDVMKKFMEEFVSFDAVHDSPVQDPTRHCHPETRRGVLKQLQDWFDDPDADESIFWLHGPAGVGKSAIAQTLARSFSRDKVPATFFFYRSDTSRNDGNRLFTTLAWQLALSIPGFKAHLINSLNERPDLPRKDVETQFEELIVRPLQALNEISSQTPFPAPVIIIDGVDECIDEKLQRRILKVIGNAINDRRVPLRFLICSRPEAHIQETIDKFQCPTLPLDLATLDDAYKDIEIYLKAEFSRIASEQDLDPTWPGEEIIQKFVYKSSGQFIYASTLIRFIDDEYSCATTQLDIVLGLKTSEAKKPFAELDALYMEILKRQPDRDFLNDILSLFIGCLLSKFYPIVAIKSYAIVMNLSEKELCRKLRGMRSLLKLDSSVDVYHRSFLDFLEDSLRSGQHHVTQQAAERQSLNLITTSIVRHVPIVLEQPDSCVYSIELPINYL